MIDKFIIIIYNNKGSDIISATNRGSKRVESDFYATPITTIDNFLNHYTLEDGNILEPSAGNGNFIKAIRERE